MHPLPAGAQRSMLARTSSTLRLIHAVREPRIPASVLWPRGLVPVSVLLDDAVPCRNPAWYEFPEQGHCAEVPNAFVEQFAGVVERTGAAGKFSIIPWPAAQGRIDQALPGVAGSALEAFLRLVRERSGALPAVILDATATGERRE